MEGVQSVPMLDTRGTMAESSQYSVLDTLGTVAISGSPSRRSRNYGPCQTLSASMVRPAG